MRRFILFLLISFSVVTWAQQTEHKVQRGETFASIAKKYGVTEVELRKANANKKAAYVGVKLKIPVIKKVQEERADIPVSSSQMEVSTSQSTASGGRSYSHLSFNKGKEYFYKKKWKKAIKAFNEVLSDPLADENTKQQSQQFLAQAQKLYKERQERREAFWSRLSEGFKDLGNSLMETSLAMQGQKTGTGSTLNTRNSSGGVRQTANRQQTSTVSYGGHSRNSSISSKKILPKDLDADHMKEFQEKGETNVILWSHNNGKSIRKIEKCWMCHGNLGMRCVGCVGGRDFTGNICFQCNGSGWEKCMMCHGDGYLENIHVFDGQGKLLSINGKSVQEIQSYKSTSSSGSVYNNTDNSSYNNNILGPSVENKTKTCSSCYGSGYVPLSLGGIQTYENSTSCNLSTWGDHVCKLEQCSICKKTHCIRLHHRECSRCKGTGREKVY
ncbi:MAG: LysM peptidoglycan-binding domain-containing protein [Prevotella sp.]|nr:LysM peptidoglycan-binding domain-containing protein [Prevotella sp.]